MPILLYVTHVRLESQDNQVTTSQKYLFDITISTLLQTRLVNITSLLVVRVTVYVIAENADVQYFTNTGYKHL